MIDLQIKTRDKSEYGDFQTPLKLARQICRWLKETGIKPEVLVEPACGRGNFIIAALETFPTIKSVYGIEIYEPYISEIKERISTLEKRDVDIKLIQENVFHFPFGDIAKRHRDNEVLVLGNPPWVTNTGLSIKQSRNLPKKSNIKNASGIEAITGKGNFDISEFITLLMLKAFANSNGSFAFLVKNSVVKNIVHSQRDFSFPITNLQQIGIDAKKEFDACVDAGLFFSRFSERPAKSCEVLKSFDSPVSRSFGWTQNKFVADIVRYEENAAFDGISPSIWRQGLKHDCSAVMELTVVENGYRNKRYETVCIESGLVYPLLKSSDLKEQIIAKTKRAVIVPQTIIGQDTKYIEADYPLTFNYLNRNKTFFEKRKSIIYRNKPPFSIFGIGSYSFKPFKVAISGLYKQTQFSLVLPIDGKPVMLDDTCYFLGFDTLEEAARVMYCLNQPEIQNLLQSIVFWDCKRVITKDILMRLNYEEVLEKFDNESVIIFFERNGAEIAGNVSRRKGLQFPN